MDNLRPCSRTGRSVGLVTLGNLFLTAIPVAAAVLAAACSQPGEAVGPRAEVVPVSRRDLSAQVLATGIVRPREGAEVRVGSRVSGIVERLHVGVGDRVERGELLAELEATGLDARLKQAAATRESAEAALDLARRNEDRADELFSSRIVSRGELDRVIATRRAAEASVKETTAALEAARVERGYSTIRAPISGVVASVNTREGETVAASFAAPTFVTILDLDRLEVWAYVDETDIGRIEVGQEARFSVDTYAGVDFPGVVTAIQPGAEVRDNVVSYVTRIEIGDDLGLTLRPEMTATVEVRLETREQVLTVPDAALRRERGRKFVLVPSDGVPTRRWVRTGWQGGGHTEILDGLEDGARVLVDEPSDAS